MQKSVVSTILIASILFSQVSLVGAVGIPSESFLDEESITTMDQGKFTSEQKSYNISRVDIDDIGYGINDSKFEKDFDGIINTIRKSKQSRSTDRDIEMLINKALTTKSQPSNALVSTLASDSLEDYIIGKLNSQEQVLYNNNRIKALLCMSNGKMAIDYSIELYQSSVLHNGNGDAFRHILWNYGMAQDVGQDFAKQWSDAHEYGSVNAPQLEKNMDLYNNSIGLTLSRENPWTVLHSTFKNNSRQAVRTGRAVIISGSQLIWSSNYGEK